MFIVCCIGQIRNAGPHGICVDASQRSALGGKVHMWHCDPLNPNQWWALQRINATEVSHPELHALKAEDGHCLGAPGGAELGREVAMRGFYYHFNNIRFNKQRILNDLSAAHVVN